MPSRTPTARTAGYTALHDAAAWLDISTRARIRAAGEDRLRLLHAIASNPVADLSPGQGTWAFFLNAQGRIQADSRIFVSEGHVLIDCEPEVRQSLFDHIENYVIMDDVELADATEATRAIAVEGPKADDLARRAFGDVVPEPAPYAHRESDGVQFLRVSLTGQPGLWIIAPADRGDEVAGKIESAGGQAASADDFQLVRVESHHPRFGEDYFNTNIPHETGLFGAFSFTKGCYLGQEIVERVRSQGQVNKLLAALELDTDEPPPRGTSVEHDGREVGKLTSPVFSPLENKVLCFGILRRAAAEPGAEITVGDIRGRVRARG